jgi:hypothetical protein
MPAADRDEEDEDGCRLPPVWDADPPAGDPPQRPPVPPAGNAAALLSPLAHAQDAVARLEASLGAASADAAQGLRARLALAEARAG